MNPEHPWFPVLATAFVVIVLVGLGLIWMPEAQKAEVGTEAPVFGGTNEEGAAVTKAEFEGKVILLNIWATWCLPCREEFPSMQRLYERYEGESFEVVAVAIDGVWKEERAWTRISDVIDHLGLTFTVLHDSKFVTPTRYRNQGVPESWLIDRKGLIVDRVLGARDWDAPEHRAKVASLVAQGR